MSIPSLKSITPMNIQNCPSPTYKNKQSLRDISKMYLQTNSKNNITLNDIHQLLINIQVQAVKNKAKYQKIQLIDSNFSHKLFKYTFQQSNIKKIGLQASLQLLLKQLDYLYEEDSLFQKQLRKLNFKNQNQNELKINLQKKSQNTYFFLKNLWKPKHTTQSQSGFTSLEQRLQNINIQVATIKKNIIQKTQFQKSTYLQNQNYYQQSIKQSFLYKNLENKYIQLNEKYQRQLKENKQNLIKNAEKNQDKYKELIKKLEDQNLKLVNQVQHLRRIIKQNQTKTHNLQKQIKRLQIAYDNQKKSKKQQNLLRQLVNKKKQINMIESFELNQYKSNEKITKNSELHQGNELKQLNRSINQHQITENYSKKQQNDRTKQRQRYRQSINKSQITRPRFKSLGGPKHGQKNNLLNENINQGGLKLQTMVNAKTAKFIRLNSPRRKIGIF